MCLPLSWECAQNLATSPRHHYNHYQVLHDLLVRDAHISIFHTHDTGNMSKTARNASVCKLSVCSCIHFAAAAARFHNLRLWGIAVILARCCTHRSCTATAQTPPTSIHWRPLYKRSIEGQQVSGGSAVAGLLEHAWRRSQRRSLNTASSMPAPPAKSRTIACSWWHAW